MQQSRGHRRHVVYELINSEMTSLNAASNNNNGHPTSSAMAGGYEQEMNNLEEREDTLLEYNISFLGSSKVGKSSILQQFLYQDFKEMYVPSATCHKYRKAVYMAGRIYDMTLRDCPGVSYFPSTSVTEWSDYNGYGLHLSQVSNIRPLGNSITNCIHVSAAAILQVADMTANDKSWINFNLTPFECSLQIFLRRFCLKHFMPRVSKSVCVWSICYISTRLSPRMRTDCTSQQGIKNYLVKIFMFVNSCFSVSTLLIFKIGYNTLLRNEYYFLDFLSK